VAVAAGVSCAAMQVSIEPHPLLDARVFITRFNSDLESFAERSPLRAPEPSPWPEPDAAVRSTIRDVLRQAGYKPTGRAKPASEYLTRAQGEGGLRPINFAVDVCNLVSLYSGLPISVVDLDLLKPPVAIAVAPEGANYVFNPAGQTIDVGRLICLQDREGPCANAVKDAQRTKTSAATRATLSVIWSSRQLQERADLALGFYEQQLRAGGAEIEAVAISPR
jgi:DNA/RNA-binding domain of Phe-tRNA-synthetase-like protein